MGDAVGTISSMGWETDQETGKEVFYAHIRFTDVPPLSPKLVWEFVPVTIVPTIPESKRTYSICPKTETGLHEWERLPPKQGGLLLTDSLAEDVNVVPRSDLQCTLCGKLYSEHVTVEEP